MFWQIFFCNSKKRTNYHRRRKKKVTNGSQLLITRRPREPKKGPLFCVISKKKNTGQKTTNNDRTGTCTSATWNTEILHTVTWSKIYSISQNEYCSSDRNCLFPQRESQITQALKDFLKKVSNWCQLPKYRVCLFFQTINNLWCCVCRVHTKMSFVYTCGKIEFNRP